MMPKTETIFLLFFKRHMKREFSLSIDLLLNDLSLQYFIMICLRLPVLLWEPLNYYTCFYFFYVFNIFFNRSFVVIT